MKNKILISFDFEGIAGITNWKETQNNSYWNQKATMQLNAFIAGILESDQNAEITVNDSHSIGNNIVWSELPSQVNLIRGYPRNDYMLSGIDNKTTHLVLFGYHSNIGGAGIMDHTYSSSSIYEIKINGNTVDEGMINAFVAAEYNTGLSFVFADNKTVEIYNKLYPTVSTLISKKTISRFSAEMFSEKTILEKLREKGRTLFDSPPFVIRKKLPSKAEISMTDTLRAYMVSVVPGIKLTSYRTVEFEFNSFKDFYRYLMTIIYISSSAKLFE